MKIGICFNLLSALRNFSSSLETTSDEELTLIKHLVKGVIIHGDIKSPSPGTDLELLVLTLYMDISSIGNLETLLEPLTKTPLPQLDTTAINLSNMHQASYIVSRLKNLAANSLEEPKAKNDFLKSLTLVISKRLSEGDENEGTEDGSVFVDLDLVYMAMNNSGRLNPNFCCYLCSQLNRAYKLQLYPYIFKGTDLEAETIKFAFEAKEIYKRSYKVNFSKEKYIEMGRKFAEEENLSVLESLMVEVKNTIMLILMKFHQENRRYMEKLLIGLLGHKLERIRSQALVLLNALYDQSDWQIRAPFLNTKVACVGEPFKIQVVVDEREVSNTFFFTNSPAWDPRSSCNLFALHQPQIENLPDSGHSMLSLELKPFTRPGFYDWKVVRIHKDGTIKTTYTELESKESHNKSVMDLRELEKKENEMMLKTSPIHGRFVVHPAGLRSRVFHEIIADNVQESYAGNFEHLKGVIGSLNTYGSNAFYIMGVLDREIKSKYGRSSPLAVRDRSKICEELGGAKAFDSLLTFAHEKGCKVFVDALLRVTSRKPSPKYNKLLLKQIDRQGKEQHVYGCSGRGHDFEDTMPLNYRKNSAWDLFLKEILELLKNHKIDGFNLDGGFMWPLMYEADEEELKSLNEEGSRRYSAKELFQGSVLKCSMNETGYWSTENFHDLPNPFIYRVIREVWQRYPNVSFMSETWFGPDAEERDVSLIKSGAIPRSNKMMIALASIYGIDIKRNGKVEYGSGLTVSSLRGWYEKYRKKLPKGNLLIQSSASHASPYTASVLKKGSWPMVDLLSFMPNIPMYFLGEIFGDGFRTYGLKVFTRITEKEREKEQPKRLKRNPFSQSKLQIHETLDDVTTVDLMIGRFLKASVEIGTSNSVLENHDHLRRMHTNLLKEVGPQFGFDLTKISYHYKHRARMIQEYPIFKTGRVIPVNCEHGEGLHERVLGLIRYLERQFFIVVINFNLHVVYVDLNLLALQYCLESFSDKKYYVKLENIDTGSVEIFSFFEIVHSHHSIVLDVRLSFL